MRSSVVICLSGMCAGEFIAANFDSAQQRTNGPACLLDLPESIAAMRHVAKRVQRADACQRDEFLAIQCGNARDEFVDGCENAILITCREQRFCRRLPQPFGIVHSDAHGERAIRLCFECAEPFGPLHIDRPHAQAVALRILHKHRGRVKSHRLVVEHGAGEGREMMHLEISRCVGDQCETRRMRLRKSVHGK